MGGEVLLMCSYLYLVFSVIWGKPVIPDSVQKLSVKQLSSGQSEHDYLDNTFSRVVASSKIDNQIDYQTYSGIQFHPSISGAKQPYPLFSQKITQNTPFKPSNPHLSLPQKTLQLSDFRWTLNKVTLQHPELQLRNFKNAEVNSDVLSSDFHSPINDIPGKLPFIKVSIHKQAGIYDVENMNNQKNYQEFSLADRNIPALQLALKNSESVQMANEKNSHEWILTFVTSAAALFSVAVIAGIFGCCCKKKRSDVNDNANENHAELLEKKNTQTIPAEETELINASDIPTGEKDLDDFTSVKEKIKAFHQSQLVLHTSPDPSFNKKSRNNIIMGETLNMTLPQEEVELRKKQEQSKSKSIGDRISKSDTQDDVSDKIFDNISIESLSISEVHNPDVVIADTDEEDEFAEIQRGTVILKSFQRAKPPRNRSPASRTSKGKIRKSRPRMNNFNDQNKSPSKEPRSRDPSNEKESARTQFNTSIPLSHGVCSNPNSVAKKNVMSLSLTDSLENHNRNGVHSQAESMEKSMDSICIKSMELSEFDSVMTESVTSIGSDIHGQKKNESPLSTRHIKKVKDSPKGDKVGRTESPGRLGKGRERDLKGDKEKRNDPPSLYKKTKDSPHGKRKHRKADKDNHIKKDEGLPSDISEDVEVKDTNLANRLSGLPPNVNNIFYLIDPTVKNKCKSVGDMTEDDNKQTHRRSGDYSKHHETAQQRGEQEQLPNENEASVGPVKRERTQSDPSRKSKLVENTQMQR